MQVQVRKGFSDSLQLLCRGGERTDALATRLKVCALVYMKHFASVLLQMRAAWPAMHWVFGSYL